MGKKLEVFDFFCRAAPYALAAFLWLGAPTAGHSSPLNSAQLATGEKIYAEQCAACHGATLLGGDAPPLVGQTFAQMLEIYPLTARQLYEFVTSRMPAGKPGQLDDAQYLEVFAYVLHLNGYKLGDKPLTQDQLKSIPLLPHPSAPQASPKRP